MEWINYKKRYNFLFQNLSTVYANECETFPAVFYKTKWIC